MSVLSVQPTFPIFTEEDGQPLENGYIWIGTANLDPQVNPIAVYWDDALTQPAAQPIRTINGYPAKAGSPGRLYVNSDYSIRVQNKNGSAIYSAPESTERFSAAVTDLNAIDIEYSPNGVGAVTRTVQAKLRDTVSVKDFGAVGDGVTDDTAAITLAIASNPKGLVFPAGTYLTTGFVIPANSNIGEIVGVGRPTLKRQGQGIVSSGLNLTIIAVYKNKLKISGFLVDGRGQSFSVPSPPSTIPPDRTYYADIAVLDAVGSADPTNTTDNFVLITDCYFKDAPGSSVAGSQAQSLVVQGNKFDGFNDHAVYVSGSTSLSADVVVQGNVIKRNGYTGGFAVKSRNRVQRFVVANNTFDIGVDGAISVDQGNADVATNYKPTQTVISGNAAMCGIFFTMNCNFTVQNPSEVNSVTIVGNNVRSTTTVFYLAETAADAFAAHLLIKGNSFANMSGAWKVLLDLRFVNSTYDNSIVFDGNVSHDYGFMQCSTTNVKRLRVLNNIFNRTYASFIYQITADSDDTTEKTAEYIGNAFVQDTQANLGTIDIGSGFNTAVSFRGNFFKNGATMQFKHYPRRVEVVDNVFEDSRGLLNYQSTRTARATAGVMVFARNRNLSTIGASTVPYLLSENAISGTNPALLSSYDIYCYDNYFKDVTNAIYLVGTGVSGYASTQKFYARDNHGTGSTFTVSYGASYKQNTLPSATL